MGTSNTRVFTSSGLVFTVDKCVFPKSLNLLSLQNRDRKSHLKTKTCDVWFCCFNLITCFRSRPSSFLSSSFRARINVKAAYTWTKPELTEIVKAWQQRWIVFGGLWDGALNFQTSPNHVDIYQTSKWGGRRGAQNVVLIQTTESQKGDRGRNLQFISISLSLLRSVLFLDNHSVSLGIERL